MTTRIDLPDDQWAEIAEPSELTNRQRKLLRAAVVNSAGVREKLQALKVSPDDPSAWGEAKEQLSATDLDALDAIQAAFIVAYTRAWSLGDELPRLDTVDDLPGPVYDALSKASARLGDGEPDVSVSMDPKAPTETSTDTESSEKVEP